MLEMSIKASVAECLQTQIAMSLVNVVRLANPAAVPEDLEQASEIPLIVLPRLRKELLGSMMSAVKAIADAVEQFTNVYVIRYPRVDVYSIVKKAVTTIASDCFRIVLAFVEESHFKWMMDKMARDYVTFFRRFLATTGPATGRHGEKVLALAANKTALAHVTTKKFYVKVIKTYGFTGDAVAAIRREMTAV
jgi:hypothetical protein